MREQTRVSGSSGDSVLHPGFVKRFQREWNIGYKPEEENGDCICSAVLTAMPSSRILVISAAHPSLASAGSALLMVCGAAPVGVPARAPCCPVCW